MAVDLLKETEYNYDQQGGDKSDLPILLRWLREAEVSIPERAWRSVGMEDYRFYAGHQDRSEVLQELILQRRPNTVYNEIKPKIDMLVGLAAQTRHEIEVIPAGQNGGPIAEIIEGCVKFFRRQMKLSRKELDCFEHTVKSGRSLLQFYVDVSNPFAPKICAKRHEGYNFYADPNSLEYDLSDARYVFIDTWKTREEIRVFWPDYDISEISGGAPSTGQYAGSVYTMPEFWNEQRRLYRVVECWYYKHDQVFWFQNPLTGQVESLAPEEFKKYAKTLEEGVPIGPNGETKQVPVPSYTKGFKKQVHYAIFSGNTVLEEGISPYKWNGFPCVLFGAYKDVETNSWFGAVTVMKAPQQALNTTRRQLVQLLQTLPKGMLVHEIGAILNIEDYEENSSKPNFHLEVAQGGLEKLKFITQPQISPVYSELDGLFRQSMKDSSGIQNELLGVQTTSREPGVSVRARQQTGLGVLYTLYDNFKDSRDNVTRMLISFIQQYVTAEQIIQIEGEDGKRNLALNSQLNPAHPDFNDITVGDYELALQDVAETASMRSTIAEGLNEYSHNNPGIVPPDIIMDYMDMPFSVQQRVKQGYEQQQQQAVQEQQLKEKELEVKIEESQQKMALAAAELRIKAKDVEYRHLDAGKQASKTPTSKAKGK